MKFGECRPWKGQRPLVWTSDRASGYTTFPPKKTLPLVSGETPSGDNKGKGIGSRAGTGLWAVLLLTYALQT